MQLGKIVSDRYFWVLCIMGAFAILSSTMSKDPVLNPFAVSLGTPADLTGIIAAASTIPGILVSLPAASLSDVFGRRKMLLFSTFVFASAPFLYLFVTVWWQLALVRFYHGFATAIFVPVAEASIAEQFPLKRGERISAFNSATYVGRGLAPFLGGSILFVTNYGFHTLYLAVGVAGVTSFVIALLLLSESKTTTVKPIKAKIATGKILHGWLEVARNRGALMVSFVQACQYYVYGVVEFYLVQYMIQVAGFNALAVSVVMGVQIVSLIVSRPIMGRFSDTSSRRTPIVLGCGISGVLLFFIPFTTQFPLLLAISIGYGLGFAMVISSTAPLMCDLTPPSLVGTSMGFLSTIMDVGQVLGPIISGVILASVLKYNGLFSSLTVLLVLSAAIFLFSGIAKAREA
ncbi:MAG: MFS transporter [Candidatus Bathyarchaeia archaeon]|jgi:MFS family permease